MGISSKGGIGNDVKHLSISAIGFGPIFFFDLVFTAGIGIYSQNNRILVFIEAKQGSSVERKVLTNNIIDQLVSFFGRQIPK